MVATTASLRAAELPKEAGWTAGGSCEGRRSFAEMLSVSLFERVAPLHAKSLRKIGSP
jgi:hypothetical protein